MTSVMEPAPHSLEKVEDAQQECAGRPCCCKSVALKSVLAVSPQLLVWGISLRGVQLNAPINGVRLRYRTRAG